MTKTIFLKSAIALSVAATFVSCSNDDELPQSQSTLETKTTTNLYAPQTGGQGQPVGGAFTKFSFSQNAAVTNDAWDIAFRGTTIIVNGGSTIGITDEPARAGNAAVSIAYGTFSSITTVPAAATFKQDGTNSYAIPTGSEAGWYKYDSASNLITPIPGKIFVIRTHDGKYVKMEILSYYKDAPANPNSSMPTRYFTFKYVYQPNGTGF